MTAEDVWEILDWLEEAGIDEVTVDGGWGVDALLGRQTRPHADLDIALPHAHVQKLRRWLADRGFLEVPRDDSRDCNFVLGDGRGRLLDVHSYTLDEQGKNVFGVAYEPHHLVGRGQIAGRPVRCPPPDVMVAFHTGYAVDENDFRDVLALCGAFGLPIPEEYRSFRSAPSLPASP